LHSGKPSPTVISARLKPRPRKSKVKAEQPGNLPLFTLPKAAPGFVEPMKALLVEDLPTGPDWIYELKFDGVRALAIKKGESVTLLSRAAKEFTGKYERIREILRALPAKEAVLDGEIVALDALGRPSFQLLQSFDRAGSKAPPLFYYVFDLINLEGRDLRGLPLLQRKQIAQKLIKNLDPSIRFSASIRADSAEVRNQMQANGLEGLIAKKHDSKYESGARSGAWVKFKWTNEQEFVIGGYTEPKGARAYFGSVLVGYYEAGKLRFAAKVGTGFDHKLLKSLYQKFQTLLSPDCPFVNVPEYLPDSGAKGLTAAEMRRCTWVRPELVCQIRFAEWTRDHHLRQPAFLGLREDKEAKEVVRERPKGSSGNK
jgi:bifunctional non-homologous end joining protein LigD